MGGPKSKNDTSESDKDKKKEKDEIKPYGAEKPTKKPAKNTNTSKSTFKPNRMTEDLSSGEWSDNQNFIESMEEVEEENPNIDQWHLRGTDPHKSPSDATELNKILTIVGYDNDGKKVRSYYFRKDGSHKWRSKQGWETEPSTR